MSDLYDMFESAIVWGAVILAVCVVSYLAYRQYLKMRYRRSRRRHRAHRTTREREASAEQERLVPDPQGPLQQTTRL